MSVTVTHNREATRFEIHVDGELAGFAEYTDADGVRDMHHTVTYPQFRGQGLAAIVVREALENSRAAELTIRPTCSYVAKFIDDNPEFQTR
ncbi:putative GNAT family acetyltransferase [Rhodococcus sp. 27YEA15]|uniref:GNAT family N-acetyltransferase n=1 Tax=Rhodococcus sp. 27YEA15 TaxID=3156259 RepID=UPI003C798C77